MRVLITGSNGLVGSFVTDQLRAQEFDVYTLDLLKTQSFSEQHIQGNLVDLDLKKIVSTISPEIVIHLAAQISVVESINDPVNDAETNIIGTLRLAEACVAGGVRKFLFANSGGAIYDSRYSPPFTEISIVGPISPYGISKYSSELYLTNILGNAGISFQSYALSNVFGFSQSLSKIPEGIIPKWLDAGLRKKPLVLRDKKSERDFIYVKDVASAFLKGINSSFEGRVNISTGQGVTLETLLAEIQLLFDYSLEVIHQAPLSGEISRSIMLSDKAQKVLAWKPEYTLPVALQETLANLKSWSQK